MSRRAMCNLLVVGCLMGALGNVAVMTAFGFKPGNSAAVVVCLLTAVWLWNDRKPT